MLRQLGSTLKVTAADLSWVSIADLLAGTALIPLLTHLGDLHGRRTVLRWTMALVVTGSVVVGLSRSLPLLLIGSVLQASMTACFPLLAGIVRERSGPSGARRHLGALVTSLVAGLAIGTVASGVVAHVFSDPIAALWVPAAATTSALLVIWRFVPQDANRSGPTTHRFEWATPLLLGGGLALVMLAISKSESRGWGWGTPRTAGTLLGGTLLVLAWCAASGRLGRLTPVSRTLLDRRSAVVSLIAIAFSFCMIGPVVPDAVYLSASPRSAGYGLGFSPLAESLALIPNLAAMGLGTIAAPRLSRRWGDRFTLATGSLLMAFGYFAALAGSRSRPGLLAALALVGLGCGCLQFAIRTLAVELAPTAATSTGSGVNEILITVGGSLGAAVVLTAESTHTIAGRLLPTTTAFTQIWSLCAVISLVSSTIALAYRPIDCSTRHKQFIQEKRSIEISPQ